MKETGFLLFFLILAGLIIYILLKCIIWFIRNVYADKYVKRAEKTMGQGDILSAIEMMRQAVVYNSHNADIYYRLGGLYAKINNYEKAVYYTQLSIQYDDQSGYPYFNLALLYKKMGKTKELIEVCKEYLQRFSSFYPEDVVLVKEWLNEAEESMNSKDSSG